MFYGGGANACIEPAARRFDPIFNKVISDLKGYLSSVSVEKVVIFTSIFQFKPKGLPMY